ncbi:MAG: type II toxin-antitoxin system VapC family toxin [Mesorhizobium sp.]|jgi:toxin FitB
MYVIDTDVLSALRKRQRAPRLETWIAAQRTSDLFISVVSVGEIERGIALKSVQDPDFATQLSVWLDRLLAMYGNRILPFDLGSSRRWGQLSAAIGNHSADLQIAATALEHGLTVVTRNVRHFSSSGVAVLDPFSSVLE